MLGDITEENQVITHFLHAYKAASIPFYLIFPGDNDKPAIQLPENFVNADPILDGLEAAR